MSNRQFLFSTIFVSVIFSGIYSNPLLAKTPVQHCYTDGQTISVIGQVASANMNNGTYFELLKPICVYYPKPPNVFTADHLNTVGTKVLPGSYVKVTGKLVDAYEIGQVGFDIHITKIINVADEVNASKASAEESCKQWQDANRAKLLTKTHNGSVNLLTGNSSTPTRQCGLWGVDTKIPHDSITIWRPEH